MLAEFRRLTALGLQEAERKASLLPPEEEREKKEGSRGLGHS